MLIKYIKDGVAGKSGEVKCIDAMQGRVLIKLGLAVLHGPTPAPAPEKKTGSRKPKKGEAFGNLPTGAGDDDKRARKAVKRK